MLGLAIVILATTTTCYIVMTSTIMNQGNLVFAQQSSNSSMSARASNTTATTAITTTGGTAQSSNKTFYLFTGEVPDLNETKFRIPADIFSLPIMEVNKDDTVIVHFYNLEAEGGDRHSFTIGGPYNIDKDLAPGQSGIVSFKADHQGIFRYYCKYHEPAMTGQLVVRP